MSWLIKCPNGKTACFACPPRSGSRWLAMALIRLHESGHIPLQRIELKNQSMDHDLGMYIPLAEIRVATIRNPFTWFESWYTQQSGRQWEPFEVGLWHPLRTIERVGLRAANSFNACIREVYRLEPSYVTRMFEWYTGPVGCPGTIIMRQESLARDLTEVFKLLGFTDISYNDVRDNLIVNAAPREPITWAKDIRQLVADQERVLIERFYGSESATNEEANSAGLQSVETGNRELEVIR